MDFSSLGIPQAYTPLATIVFVVVLAAGAGFARLIGKKEGPPKVQEFYASGALYDMGPVKELVEATGLLVQQQVRTNLILEAVASALKSAADSYAGQLAAERNEAEIEQEVQRRFDRELERERRARRRVAPRRKPGS